MKVKVSCLWAFLLFCSLSVTPALWGQVGIDGSILGVVKDKTGAVVPGVEVRVINLNTGLTKSAITDEAGYFEILALPRGIYSVAASLPAFKTWKLERTELTVGEQKRVAPELEVGEVSDEVHVEAQAELIQTERASLDSVIQEKQIRDLPLSGRNPISLVRLVPGMRFVDVGGLAREHTVQGLGQRDDATEFSVDGMNVNDPSNEKGIAFPNLDTVAEFSVETSNFSAEHGRNPIQVLMVTKTGGNQIHGTAFEFHQNAALDARNAFAVGNKPKLIHNQYGFTLGGPVLKNKVFFFGSFEGTRVRTETIYNSVTVTEAMLRGDFSAISRRITDPVTKQPFPGNIIPENRFSNASKFFFPYILKPNFAPVLADGTVGPKNRFRDVAPRPNDLYNYSLRLDDQITSNQRVYIRWVRLTQDQINLGYRPGVFQDQELGQHNVALNYNWSITPTMLFTLSGGFLYSDTTNQSPVTGKENLTQQAGIRGFPTEGRADSVGLPNVTFTGYTGFSVASNTPGRFRREIIDLKSGLNLVRRNHSIGFGYSFDDRRTLARHSSASARGTFTFNGQYTGDPFADYLLGLVQFGERNYPLQDFGMAHSPYSSLYVQDFWKVVPSVTLGLGVRLDYWHEKAFVRGSGATFDVSRGKVIAGENSKGQVDLTSQPVAPFLYEATKSLIITATDAGVPGGLFKPRGFLSPRLGAAWRVTGTNDLVVRAGYGIFTTMFNGNITGSQIIGPPFWTFERQTLGTATLQSWETLWPQDPRLFIAPSVAAAAFDVLPEKIHEWNVSIQKALPFRTAVTVSYVGNRGVGLITRNDHNEVAPGQYANLQAARPFPTLGTVRIYENIGRSWYNALQLRVDRRFSRGLAYNLGYVFARNIDENGASTTDFPAPFAPKGYDRGRSQLERRHILSSHAVYEIPVGRGRTFLSVLHPVVNGVLGGWQLSGIYIFTSGTPLTFMVASPAGTLGNGLTTRADLVGDPKLAHPSTALWFNKSALVAPPLYRYGNSGQGLIDGPADHTIDLALMKNFNFTEERFLQFRWEVFNAINKVNLNEPDTRIGVATAGQI
ncbi:MAG TPA: TonB-dependent receptor, partial [Acidobacteriota bacterium]